MASQTDAVRKQEAGTDEEGEGEPALVQGSILVSVIDACDHHAQREVVEAPEKTVLHVVENGIQAVKCVGVSDDPDGHAQGGDQREELSDSELAISDYENGKGDAEPDLDADRPERSIEVREVCPGIEDEGGGRHRNVEEGHSPASAHDKDDSNEAGQVAERE